MKISSILYSALAMSFLAVSYLHSALDETEYKNSLLRRKVFSGKSGPTDKEIEGAVEALKERELWDFYRKTSFKVKEIHDPLVFSNIVMIERTYFRKSS